MHVDAGELANNPARRELADLRDGRRARELLGDELTVGAGNEAYHRIRVGLLVDHMAVDE